MDDMEALRRLWEETPEGSRQDLAPSREVLLRAAAGGRKPMFRRWAWRGLAVVAAGAVAVAGVQILPGATPPASAQELLARAADAASGQAELQVGPGQYVHVRSLTVTSLTDAREAGGGDVRTAAVVVAEDRWEPADPGKPWLSREEARSATPLPGSKPIPAWLWQKGVEDTFYASSCDKAPDGSPSYLRLGSWPTDVAALRERIWQKEPLDTWRKVTELVKQSAARPSLTAPLFQVAAGIKGVQLIPDVTDAAGRPGLAVAMDEGDGLRNELVFDKETYRYLGERFVTSREHKEQLPNGRTLVTPAGTVTGSALLGVEVTGSMPAPSANASHLKIPC